MLPSVRCLCRLPALLLSIGILLCACSPTDRFSAGHPISKEELASLSAELFTASADPTTDRYAEAESYPAGAVHWTDGGTVYHLDPACYHLRRADTVHHGTRTDAEAVGKQKVCSACGTDEAATAD